MSMEKRYAMHEGPLGFLPRKPIQEFAKNRMIYGGERPNDHLYAVIMGRVKVSITATEGSQTVKRIVSAEGVFGQSCLVGASSLQETAMALDDDILMSWSRVEVEAQIEREPSLGIALVQYFARQCGELQDRIESMAVYKTSERVMLALLQLANDLGSPMADGVYRLAALTHQTIAEYVGTSREIVTIEMNRLRGMGMLRYSRKFIDVYTGALRASLRERGIGQRDATSKVHRAGA